MCTLIHAVWWKGGYFMIRLDQSYLGDHFLSFVVSDVYYRGEKISFPVPFIIPKRLPTNITNVNTFRTLCDWDCSRFMRCANGLLELNFHIFRNWFLSFNDLCKGFVYPKMTSWKFNLVSSQYMSALHPIWLSSVSVCRSFSVKCAFRFGSRRWTFTGLFTTIRVPLLFGLW
jgi:hypothetical protein